MFRYVAVHDLFYNRFSNICTGWKEKFVEYLYRMGACHFVLGWKEMRTQTNKISTRGLMVKRWLQPAIVDSPISTFFAVRKDAGQ